jgi:hypothetical protein
VTIDEFIALLKDTDPPAPADQLAAFESTIGGRLPDDYREFLIRTNGGYVPGWHRFKGPGPNGRPWTAFIHHVCGFRTEPHLSLHFNHSCGLNPELGFPRGLLWIMDDPGGNGIGLGLTGDHRGRIYFWVHDELPDPETWDREIETAENVIPLADSFATFVAGVGPREADDDG